MPEVAPGEDATGLTTQLMAESAAAISEHAAKQSEKSTSSETTPENGGSETPEEAKAPEVQPENGEETPETPKSDEADPQKEEGKQDTDPETSKIVLGNREFATMQDATKEYNRVVGHNAHLAGEKKAVESRLAAVEAELAKAYAANQEWVEYASAQKEGREDVPAPEATPNKQPQLSAEEVARIAAETIEKQQKLAQFNADIDELEALPNYAQVVDTIVSLSEKINPFTETYYTPKEAYAAACLHLGVDNLLNKTAKQSSPPRTVANPEASKAAARPVPGNSASPAPKSDQKDSWEEHVDKQFSRLNPF